MKRFQLELSIALLLATVYCFFAFVVGQVNPLSLHVDAGFGIDAIFFSTASGLIVAVKIDKDSRGD